MPVPDFVQRALTENEILNAFQMCTIEDPRDQVDTAAAISADISARLARMQGGDEFTDEGFYEFISDTWQRAVRLTEIVEGFGEIMFPLVERNRLEKSGE